MRTNVNTSYATLFLSVIFLLLISFFSKGMESSMSERRLNSPQPRMTVIDCLNYFDNQKRQGEKL